MPVTYYVDSALGSDANDGLSMAAPLRSIDGRRFLPGDHVLFRRGTEICSSLLLCDGSEEGYITYGAYGEGERPVVNPSIDASGKSRWREAGKNLWIYTGKLPAEAANLIFDDGEGFGNLRWSPDELSANGQWYYTKLGGSMRAKDEDMPSFGGGELYLYSELHPAAVYRKIEIAVWSQRMAVTAKRYVVLQDLIIEKSAVHGFQATGAHHIQIRRCEFRFIGGGVFDADARVRLGNAVEFWDGAHDCIVEHCLIRQIYDSGVTHQGFKKSQNVPRDLYFRNNIFCECGLSAYEWRGPCSKNVYFENNLCVRAGGAFTLQGEAPPRRTEIAGTLSSCVFVLLWFLTNELESEEPYATICGNIFCDAPSYGAAMASLIDARQMERFVIDRNTYIQSGGGVFMFMNGRRFRWDQFGEFQKITGKEPHGILKTSIFRLEKDGVQ